MGPDLMVTLSARLFVIRLGKYGTVCVISSASSFFVNRDFKCILVSFIAFQVFSFRVLCCADFLTRLSDVSMEEVFKREADI